MCSWKKTAVFVLMATLSTWGLAQDEAASPAPSTQESAASTPAPMDMTKKTKSLALTKFMLGPSLLANTGEGRMHYSLGVGQIFQVAPTAEIRGESTLAWAKDSVYWNLGIGAAWLPLPGNVSPIFGALFGLGASDSKTTSGSFGFSGSLLGGARFFKESDKQLEALFRYTTIFDSNNKGVPMEFSLSLGVLF